MIKLEVEIKDDKFAFTYTVGENRSTGETNLSAESLASFTDLLRICSTAWQHQDKKWEREAVAKAWLEKQKPASQGEK